MTTAPPSTITSTILDLVERIGEAIGQAVEEGLRAGIGTDSTNAQPGIPWINIYAMVTGKNVKGFGLRAGGVTTLGAIGTGGTLSFVEGTINQSEYTLKPPSDCAKNQDHLRQCT